MAIAIAPFYNVQYAVGPGKPNVDTDVMLVQYMLFTICVSTGPCWMGSNPNPIGGSVLIGPTAGGKGGDGIYPVDGKFTSRTSDWIKAFQSVANQRSLGPLTVDGIVNRAPIGWGKPQAKKTGGWYTIQALNRCLQVMNGRTFRNFVEKATDAPAALRERLGFVDFSFYDGPGA
ncbi:hypothetical protein DES42_107191 [Zavarzinia compransoris]|uniref:Uncharacterized protein n=2 Tax=Zavarzinia compransoris TaxID=1264899 RepID=A0A317E5U9_9PROT|nr:hypothetical protein DKG75_12165 [Zavarzinia compransoris]TDP44424.1 hypothetical protein DES42_107191 [Zavarzinia compransoris]